MHILTHIVNTQVCQLAIANILRAPDIHRHHKRADLQVGIDANGLVNEWNNKAAEITGFARSKVIGQSLVEVHITQVYRASVKGVLDNALLGAKQPTSSSRSSPRARSV
jgi:PAS domain S-box-containing protein